MPTGAVCAEIGVYKGDFSRHILRVTRPRELHLIDGWWTLGEDFGPCWYGSEEPVSTRWAYEDAKRAVEGGPCTFHVGDDLEILASFPDRYFDWVYLDTSHQYEQTVNELALLRSKVKPSGIVAGDDWFEDPAHEYHGVCRAVREFCERHGLEPEVDELWSQWLVRLG
jgi:hypothetical protein